MVDLQRFGINSYISFNLQNIFLYGNDVSSMEMIYNKSKILGISIVGISIILTIIIISLSQTVLRYGEELHKLCPLPVEVCPIKRGELPTESVLGFTTLAVLLGIGLYLLLIKPKKEIKETEKFRKMLKSLSGDEKKIYEIIMKEDGTIFQNDLVLKSGYSKVKVSRILDRLEVKGLVERRRRGLVNLVILR